MTKYSQTAKIRHAVRQVAQEKARASSRFRRKFTKDDVREQLDIDPSDRTLRDKMNTMMEQGYIKDATGRGKYEPGDVTVIATFSVSLKGTADDTEEAAQFVSELGFEQIDAEQMDDDALLSTVMGEFEVRKGENPAAEVANQVNRALPHPHSVQRAEVTVKKVI